MNTNTWTLEEAVELCRRIEAFAPECGCHVALTGGTLYKDGPRKDCDILFYRIRQWQCINKDELYRLLEEASLIITSGEPWKWVVKPEMNGKKVDLFFPEEQGGDTYSTQ